MAGRSKPGLTKKVLREYNDILELSYAGYRKHRVLSYNGSRRQPHYPSIAWSAYFFAKRWQGRSIDLKKLQRIVLTFGSPKCIYMFARDVEGANLRRLAHALIERGDPKLMREFADNIDVIEADSRFLTGMAAVAEVMAL